MMWDAAAGRWVASAGNARGDADDDDIFFSKTTLPNSVNVQEALAGEEMLGNFLGKLRKNDEDDEARFVFPSLPFFFLYSLFLWGDGLRGVRGCSQRPRRRGATSSQIR